MDKKERIKGTIALIILIMLFLQLLPFDFNIQDNTSAAEPDVIDNGNGTITATWDFNDTNDYNLFNTTLDNGAVNLTLEEFWWNQTTQLDFLSGTFFNTTATPGGDVELIITQQDLFLLKNESFAPSLDDVWVYNESRNILSSWNSSGENAQLNFSFVSAGPQTVNLYPFYDGMVWDDTNNQWDDYGKEDVSTPGYVGFLALGGTDFLIRMFFYFNISSIPDYSTITDVEFYTYLDAASDDTTHRTDIHALDNDSIQNNVTNESLYFDCSDGRLYINDSSDFSFGSPLGQYFWSLGLDGRLDLKNNLTRDWFGVSFEEENDNDRIAEIATSEDGGNEPELSVTYAGITFNETAYVNQTFTKNTVTQDIPGAVKLSFDYVLENVINVSDGRLIVEIDGAPVWVKDINTNESSSEIIDIGSYTTAAKDYEISLQLYANVSTLDTISCQAIFDNVNITAFDFLWEGNFTSDIHSISSQVIWNEMSWDFSSPLDTDFTIRTRTSSDGISWSDWSDEYSNSNGEQITSQMNSNIQYMVNLSSTNFMNKPALHDVNISYSKYCWDGWIEMKDDFIPKDHTTSSLTNWGTFIWEEKTNLENNITYWYSIDSGGNWSKMPNDGNLSSLNISTGMIRFRANFTTYNSTSTPTLFKWILTFEVGELGSLVGYVDPGVGYITTWFNFTVNYSDPDNDKPVNVTLNITGGTSHLGYWDMEEVDPNDQDYTDGKLYYFNDTNFLRGSNYTFHFAALDQNGFWSESGTKDGPYVLNSPPKITTSNVQSADEGELYYVDYEANDLENDTLTWSLGTNASWLSINFTTGELEGTPSSGDRGVYWVNVTISDGYGGSDWTNFTLLVGNKPPFLSGKVDPGYGYITTWFNFTVNYSDAENDEPLNITLNITEGTSHLGGWEMKEVDIGDNNYTDGKLYYFNDTNFLRGDYKFYFTALDPGGFWVKSPTQNGPYVLNSPPKITTSNDQGAEEGTLYYVDYEADDLEGDTLTWSLNTNATWLNINSTTGELQGTPQSMDKGSYWVKIMVSDGHGGYDWANFTLVVGDTIPPVADAGEDDIAHEDDEYTFNGTNSTDNSGILNYTWYFGDGSLGYDTTPSHTYNQSGIYLVVLIVRDPLDNEDMAIINITVINEPPIADAGPDQTVYEGEMVYFNGSNSYDTQSDNVSLIFLWDFDDDGEFDDGVGALASYTWYDDASMAVKLKVVDDDGDFDVDEMIVTVLNVAPTVDIGDYLSGDKGAEVIVIASAFDPGYDSLEFRWDWESDGNYDTGWSIDFVGRNIWGSVGTYTVRVQVRDDDADTGTDIAQINITPRKSEPVISPLGPRQIRYNASYIIDLAPYITDEDTIPSELVVWTSDPINITVDGLILTLKYPDYMKGETVYVEIYVTDGTFIDNETLKVTITENYPPTLTDSISDVEFFEDNVSEKAFNLNHYFEDEDGDKLAFSYSGSDTNLNVLIDNDGRVTFRPLPNWFGITKVIFKAQDPSGAFAEDEILVSVIPVNDPPIIKKQITYKTIGENDNWTIYLYDYFIDLDDSVLTFSCNNPEIQIDHINHTAIWVPNNKKTLRNVIFTADDGEQSISLDPIDLKVVKPEVTPFNWLYIILPFVLGILVFAFYREVRYRCTVEEAFLVDNAGVLLVHISRGESKAIDAKLVSGMLTAVQEFVKDSFRRGDETEDMESSEEALGKLEYGDFQIVTERGNYSFLSAVISGYDNKRLRRKMRAVIEDFEKKYSSVLADWNGDMSEFDGAEEIVGVLFKKPSNLKGTSDKKNSEACEIGDQGISDDTVADELSIDAPDDKTPSYDESDEDLPPPPPDWEENA